MHRATDSVNLVSVSSLEQHGRRKRRKTDDGTLTIDNRAPHEERRKFYRRDNGKREVAEERGGKWLVRLVGSRFSIVNEKHVSCDETPSRKAQSRRNDGFTRSFRNSHGARDRYAAPVVAVRARPVVGETWSAEYDRRVGRFARGK